MVAARFCDSESTVFDQPACSKPSFSPIMDANIHSLASRVVESNRSREDPDDDDDAIFAELEAEIENADSAVFREHGLEQLRLQCVVHLLFGIPGQN